MANATEARKGNAGPREGGKVGTMDARERQAELVRRLRESMDAHGYYRRAIIPGNGAAVWSDCDEWPEELRAEVEQYAARCRGPVGDYWVLR